MTIGIKLSGSGYSQINQPYYKTGPSTWTPLKKVFYKTPEGWKEVWPQVQIYTHTGYGYQMNIAACFGNPTTPTNYIFINNGYIGGALGGQVSGGPLNIALRTGALPAGSNLTIINNWVIAGAGGDGASYYSASKGVYSGDYPARQGGYGLVLEYPCYVDNTNGYIRGGGGGGGARGEWGGANDNHAPGGGGAGIPGGQANVSGWNPTLTGDGAIDYWPNNPGTELAGGTRGGSWTGAGGAPGAAGQRMTNNISKDKQRELPPGSAGIAIANSGYLTGSAGLVAGKVAGAII